MTTPIELGTAARLISATGKYDSVTLHTVRLSSPQYPTENNEAIIDLGEKHMATIVDRPEFTAISITSPNTDEHFALPSRKKDKPREFLVYNSNGTQALRVRREEKLPNNYANTEVSRQEFHIQGPSILERATKAITVFSSRFYQYQRYATI